jgi:hypothetical protein
MNRRHHAGLALSNTLMDIPEGNTVAIEQIEVAQQLVIESMAKCIPAAAQFDMVRAAHRLIIEAVRDKWDADYTPGTSAWLGYAIEAMGHLRHHLSEI